MRFVLTGHVLGFSANESQVIELQVGGQNSIWVELYVEGLHMGAIVRCRARGDWELDKRTEAVLLDNCVLPPTESFWHSDPVLRLSSLPLDVRTKVKSVERELLNASTRVINLLRWTHGVQGGHAPLAETGIAFSHEGKNVYIVHDSEPWLFTVDEPSQLPLLPLTPQLEENLHYFVDQGISEPLGHSLLREALGHQDDNPRSALVIGVAAVEIGVRQFFAEFATPFPRKLLSERQSVPVPKLLSEYFPVLCSEREEFAVKKLPNAIPSKEIINPIRLASEHRNTVVHAPPTQPKSHRKLENWLDAGGLGIALNAISDLLWLLDYYRGYYWALEHVGSETAKAWQNLSR